MPSPTSRPQRSPAAGREADGASPQGFELRRELLVVAAVCAAGWTLSLLLPTESSLATSLAVLPWVGWLLASAQRPLASGLDAHHAAPGRIAAAAPWALAAALGISALVLEVAGWLQIDRLYAPLAWLALLLFFYSRRKLAIATLPATGARPGIAFFLAPLALYLTLLPWSTEQRPPDGDEPWYLLVAHSLAFDLDTDLRNNYEAGDSLRFMDRAIEPQPGDPVGPQGQQVSRHAPTLPVLMAIPYRLGGALGAYLTIALLTAALAWLSLDLIWRAVVASAAAEPPAGAALAAWTLLFAFSPLLLYSHQIWVEVPAALLCLIGYRAARGLAERPSGRLLASDAVLLLAVLLALPLLKLRFALLSGGLLLVVLYLLRRQLRQRLGALTVIAGALVAAVAALLVYNRARFGNPLRIHSWEELLIQEIPLATLLVRLGGPFFDLAFGLFATAPLWLLLIPGALAALRRNRGVLLHGLLLYGPYFVLAASRREWYGGWSPPFRYSLVTLPWLALLVALALAERTTPPRRGLAATLLVATLVLGVLSVEVPGWTYNFADGRTLLLDQVERAQDVDIGRLLPSSTRPRLASWLTPPALTAAVLLLWLLPWPGRAKGRDPLPAVLVAIGLGFVALAALPAAMRAVPTWRIEPEAAFVERTAGNVEPQVWQFDRTNFPEAWVLPDGGELAIPVRRGGDDFQVHVLSRFIRNRDADLELELALDGTPVGTMRFSLPDAWRLVSSEPFAWPPEVPARAELTVRASPPRGEGPPGVTNGVAIDRIEIEWDP